MSTPTDNQPTLRQLPFPFYLHEKYTFNNFYPGTNEVVLTCLQQLIQQHDFAHSVYLWGHRFVGCSHLLQACCEEAQKTGLKAVYLSLAYSQEHYAPSDLNHLVQSYELVCLDDIESISASPAWEEALFFTYNDLVAHQVPIVFAAHQVPHKLQFNLPDLVSRLNSGLLFQVHELDDAQKALALQLRANLRGLELPKPVAQFLLSRLPRSPRVLLDALNQLDIFALSRQRKLTMPFVKEVLGI